MGLSIDTFEWLLILVEASTKGVNSLLRTLEMQQELEELGAFTGKILRIVPKGEKWFGRQQSNDSKDAIAAIRKIGQNITGFSSILFSG